jgi:hypothetical protein
LWALKESSKSPLENLRPTACHLKKELEIIKIKFVGAEGVLEESFGEPPTHCLSFEKRT